MRASSRALSPGGTAASATAPDYRGAPQPRGYGPIVPGPNLARMRSLTSSATRTVEVLTGQGWRIFPG
ncbi:hypothetical protein QFZ76_000383 [Streptomyces sp. V4I2]|nr:hypothetical protein [Streptomyces sp. V4I2]